MTLLASQAAVAIENARLYENDRRQRGRVCENELRFAQRVQAALLPSELPKRMKGVDVAARFAPARELGGDLYDYLSPEAHTLVVAVGDVSGKGVPAALDGAFAGETDPIGRSAGATRPRGNSPATVLLSTNTILHVAAALEQDHCTLCYAGVRPRAPHRRAGELWPRRSLSGARETSSRPIEIAGVPLGSFAGSSYDEIGFELSKDDVFVFCTGNGVFEAMNAAGDEFRPGAACSTIVRGARSLPAREIVDRILAAVEVFRGDHPPNDDMTAVAIRITG